MAEEMGIVAELVELQRARNREWAEMTPEQRTAASIEDLRGMEGQAYLFERGTTETGGRDT